MMLHYTCTYQITRPRNYHSCFRNFMFSYIGLYVKNVTSGQGHNLSKGGRRRAQLGKATYQISRLQ